MQSTHLIPLAVHKDDVGWAQTLDERGRRSDVRMRCKYTGGKQTSIRHEKRQQPRDLHEHLKRRIASTTTQLVGPLTCESDLLHGGIQGEFPAVFCLHLPRRQVQTVCQRALHGVARQQDRVLLVLAPRVEELTGQAWCSIPGAAKTMDCPASRNSREFCKRGKYTDELNGERSRNA